MKKKLLLLPLIAAGLTLTGCGKDDGKGPHVHTPGTEWFFDETYHWHKCVGENCNAKKKHLNQAEHDLVEDLDKRVEPTLEEEGHAYYHCSVCGYEYDEDLSKLVDKRGPATFGSYVRVDELVSGETYIFGYYDAEAKSMRFANGNYHKDSNGEYPFYLATTDNTAEGAAQFTVNAVADSDEFTIFVTTPDDVTKPWNEKYFSLYSAVTTAKNNVFSIAPVDNLTDKYEDKDHKLNDVYGKFTFYETVGGAVVNSIGTNLVHDDETEPAVRLFGCKYPTPQRGNKYVSIDCSDIGKAISEDYAIAHFYKLAA